MGVAERKEREKEQRRNDIIDAAEKVFFSKGVENATMDEVATAAEYSKGTLYLYFKNKNELFHGIICRALGKLYEMFTAATAGKPNGLARIYALGQAYHQFYETEPEYFMALLHQEKLEVDKETLENSYSFACCHKVGNKIFDFIKQCIEEGIEDGSVHKDHDPSKLSLILWGHTAGVLHILKSKETMLETTFGGDTGEIVEYSFRLIGNYLINGPAAARL